MGSEQNRFPHPHHERGGERRKRWGGCLSSCLGGQKGGKRIVPATRIPNDNNSSSSLTPLPLQQPSQPTALLAPPSSPASFTNSTVQSPTCFAISNSSPANNTMFATGPYAHEPQLVSPPVFSTFTTEPSTAPVTPPPELPHLSATGTPSSPDVPFARFLDSNFFCPATFAQFYLDPHAPGRLSVSNSKDSDAPLLHKQKQDVEEIEAYRASFGFSADEIITTPQYVEISDVMDDSFTITPFSQQQQQQTIEPLLVTGLKPLKTHANSQNQNHNVFKLPVEEAPDGCQDEKKNICGSSNLSSDEEDIFAKMRSSRKYEVGLSSSDAEIDYRRGRSLRERKDFTWLTK